MPSHVSDTAWLQLLKRLDLADPQGITLRRLKAAYRGPGRHYHTLDHIDDCLKQLAGCGLPEEQADPLALALWFHDAVYNWRSATNETDSAALASTFLKDAQASEDLITKVEALILATRHFVPGTLAGDSALIVDIDLSILGREPSRYDRYERAIRQEYIRVPFILYRRGRRQVLRSFLNRQRIFFSERFRDLYEVRARHNIAHAIRML